MNGQWLPSPNWNVSLTPFINDSSNVEFLILFGFATIVLNREFFQSKEPETEYDNEIGMNLTNAQFHTMTIELKHLGDNLIFMQHDNTTIR